MDVSQMLDLGRRDFLARTSAMGAASLLGLHHLPAAAEPPPETTKIRFVHAPAICLAPQYLAEELLRLEGFTEVEYLPVGEHELARTLSPKVERTSPCGHRRDLIPHLDAGKPIVVLAGVHGGCYELFGNERVRAIRDLKGKTVAIHYLRGRGPYPAVEHAGVRGHRSAAGGQLDRRRGRARCDGLCSSKARPTPSSALPSSRRSCARRRSGT